MKDKSAHKGPVNIKTEDQLKQVIEKRDDLHRAYDRLYVETASRIFASGLFLDGDPNEEADSDEIAVMAKKALHYACAFMDELSDRMDAQAMPVAEKHVCTSGCGAKKTQEPTSSVKIVCSLMSSAGKMLEFDPFIYDHYAVERAIYRDDGTISFKTIFYFKDDPSGVISSFIRMDGDIIEEGGYHVINSYNTSPFTPIEALEDRNGSESPKNPFLKGMVAELMDDLKALLTRPPFAMSDISVDDATAVGSGVTFRATFTYRDEDTGKRQVASRTVVGHIINMSGGACFLEDFVVSSLKLRESE